MVSYALIIIIVLGLFVLVYAYLQLQAPKERASCSQDISLVMRDAGCSIAEINPACRIRTKTVILSAVLVNKGNHQVAGAYLRLGAPGAEVKELINKDKLFFNSFTGSNQQSGVPAGQSMTFTASYEDPVSIAPGTLDLEIQPFVGTPEKFQVCDESVVVQRVVCATGNVPPTVEITEPASSGSVVLADSRPKDLSFTITASDCDGQITKVQLLERSVGQTQGAESVYPVQGTGSYTLSRTITSGNGYAPGEYVFTAVAYDDKGGKSFSSPIVYTLIENQLPLITTFQIQDSEGNLVQSTTTGEDLTLVATASDPEGELQSVRFRRTEGGVVYDGAQRNPDGSFSLALGKQPRGTWNFAAEAIDSFNTLSAPVTNAVDVQPQPLPPGTPVHLYSGVHPAGSASGTIATTPLGTDGKITTCKTIGSPECQATYVTSADPATPTEIKLTVTPDVAGARIAWASAGTGCRTLQDELYSCIVDMTDHAAIYPKLDKPSA